MGHTIGRRINDAVCLRCYILGCSQGIYLHSEAGPGQEAKILATFAVYGQHGPALAFIVCVC